MRLPRNIAYTHALTATDKLVWTTISDLCDQAETFNRTDRDGGAVISTSELARSLGIGRSTAIRSINKLDAMGLIVRIPSEIPTYPDSYMIPPDYVIDSELARAADAANVVQH